MKKISLLRARRLHIFGVFKFCIELAHLTPQVHLTVHVRNWHRGLAPAPHSMNNCETTTIHLRLLGEGEISTTWLPHRSARCFTLVFSPLSQLLCHREHDQQTR